MVYIVMGVSGCGKTTVGRLFAQRRGLPFHDADSFHSAANVNKMRKGSPLTDDDRLPWLRRLAGEIAHWNAGKGAVLACSALKQRYRDILAGAGGVRFVHLKGSPECIRRRMEQRSGHFMNSALLDSQFADLEEPHDALTVAIDGSPEEICGRIMVNIGVPEAHEERP